MATGPGVASSDGIVSIGGETTWSSGTEKPSSARRLEHTWPPRRARSQHLDAAAVLEDERLLADLIRGGGAAHDGDGLDRRRDDLVLAHGEAPRRVSSRRARCRRAVPRRRTWMRPAVLRGRGSAPWPTGPGARRVGLAGSRPAAERRPGPRAPRTARPSSSRRGPGRRAGPAASRAMRRPSLSTRASSARTTTAIASRTRRRRGDAGSRPRHLELRVPRELDVRQAHAADDELIASAAPAGASKPTEPAEAMRSSWSTPSPLMPIAPARRPSL